MSNVKIEGNASGTGTFTIAAPNTNTDYSLTLPETTGGEFVVTDSSGNVGVGTSSPTNGKIEISNSTDGYESIRVNDSRATPSANKRTIDLRYTGANGRTASNTQMLYLYDSNASSTQPFIQVDGSSSTHFVLDSSGNLIGGSTTSTTGSIVWSNYGKQSLDIRRYADTGNVAIFRDDTVVSGTISVSGSSCSYNTSSDYRLKEDWQPMSGSIDRLKNLNPVNFAWKASGERVDGFLAHEAAEVVPEAVTGEKDAMRTEEYEVTPAVLDDDGNVVTEAVMGTREVPDYQGIDQAKLVPLLTAALQEAVSKIEALETRIAALEA
jgi:hypothetical protein